MCKFYCSGYVDTLLAALLNGDDLKVDELPETLWFQR
jgi:hypothetical protein